MWTLRWRDRGEHLGRLAWFRFKQRLGVTTHVDKNFFALDAAVRLRAGVLPAGVGMTSAGRSDGAGMQALAKMSGIAFAHAFGATYYETPFARIDHADRPMGDWIGAWEALFNFADGYPSTVGRERDVLDYADYLADPALLRTNTILRFQQCHWFTRRHPNAYLAVVDRFRRAYRFQNRPDDHALVVAIHVRRGDVSARASAGRYTSDEVIQKKVRMVAAALSALQRPFHLEIHSQGPREAFGSFEALGCALHLDRDAIWTMQRLVEADILVMSKSSFCFVAGLIGDGIRIYEQWRNRPVAGWVSSGRDGSIDIAALKAQPRLLPPVRRHQAGGSRHDRPAQSDRAQSPPHDFDPGETSAIA